MSQVEQNKEAIQANRQKINKIDTVVMNNKASIYQSRSMIEENRLMILSNYAAAFMGNRQLANHNTADIRFNLNKIAENTLGGDDCEEQNIELVFLKHQQKLNKKLIRQSF